MDKTHDYSYTKSDKLLLAFVIIIKCKNFNLNTTSVDEHFSTNDCKLQLK